MLKLKHIILIVLISFISSFIVTASAQYNIPKKPDFIPPVIDSTNTLTKQEHKFLFDKLKNYNDTTSTEVIIVIIPTTKGENIGILAPKWGHKWEIGQAKEDYGVFILLAKEDRKIWISPGYGVEDRLTAGVNGELIRNVIIPEFKKDDYFQGLNKGTDAIFNVLAGKYQMRQSDNSGDAFPVIFFIILFIIFIIFILAISKNRRGGGHNGGNRTNGTSILDAIILSNMGRGSYGGGSRSSGGIFGGSSSSGGGFGGFGGGGGFSGGGAGGSW
jgi:uncharacterized protein